MSEDPDSDSSLYLKANRLLSYKSHISDNVFPVHLSINTPPKPTGIKAGEVVLGRSW